MQPRTNCTTQNLAQTDGINYETQSLQSGVRYTQSAIGEMNLDELQQLIEKNARKQNNINDKFDEKKKSIISYKDANQQMKDKWSTKEQYYDDSTSYPSYGRGMQPPNINMNTFMIQQEMGATKKEEASGVQKGDADLQPNSRAQKRQRIIEPHRKKYEKQFESVMKQKYVDQVVNDLDKKQQEWLKRPDFDNKSKVGSISQRLTKNMQLQQYQHIKNKEDNMHRSLKVIEEDVVDTNDQARVITLPKEWNDRLKAIFDKACQNQRQQTYGDEEPKVKREPFLIDILEDAWFEQRLDEVVRVSVDMEPETLD